MIYFKNDKVASRFGFLCPPLYEILTHADKLFTLSAGLDLVITETVTTPEEDKKAGRKSRAHDYHNCRAVDIRVWTDDNVSKFGRRYICPDIQTYILTDLLHHYRHYAYLSNSWVNRIGLFHRSSGIEEKDYFTDKDDLHLHLAVNSSNRVDNSEYFKNE